MLLRHRSAVASLLKSHMANKQYLRLLALILMVFGLGLAQEPTGGITGTVVDPSGATVPRATVTVEDQRTGRTFVAKTTETGEFTFPALAAGRYRLKMTHKGLRRMNCRRSMSRSTGRFAFQHSCRSRLATWWTCQRRCSWLRPHRRVSDKRCRSSRLSICP